VLSTTTSTIGSTTTSLVAGGLVDLSPSILVSLRYATAQNFTGAVLPGYQANRGLLRPAAAAALLRADTRLRARGLRLLVLDAYRPVRATNAMVAWARGVGRPDLIGPYIASHSEHNLGVAADVTLVDVASGTELDMGAPFDTFSPAAHFAGATGVAEQHRQLLRSAMLSAGFTPYDGEWWHFSVPTPGAVALDVVIR
jgi:zinc D-Ala-D-Ala dipeptidase